MAARRSPGKKKRTARESRAQKEHSERRSAAARKAARTRKQEARDVARLIRQAEAIDKRERFIRGRAASIGKALGRGRPVSLQIARAVQREWRALGKNPRVLNWVIGFQQREAKRTGRLPSVEEVRRNPQFRAALDVIFATDKAGGGHKSSRAASGPLARALVALGVRDPDLQFDVGSYVIEDGRYVRRVQRK